MTTSATPQAAASTTPLRWWRDWLLLSLIAIFVVSLIAAHLPPALMKIVIFPIGICVVGGLAIRKCAELAGDVGFDTRSARIKLHVAVVCLLLAGLAHSYWIVFDRYLGEAREHREELMEERNEQQETRAQVVEAIARHGEHVVAQIEPLPPLPTFITYLRQRVHGDNLPNFLSSGAWPMIVFGLEIMLGIVIGTWFAVEGPVGDKSQRTSRTSSADSIV
jgi:hypothetical protein